MAKIIEVTDAFHMDEPFGYLVPTPQNDPYIGPEYQIFQWFEDAERFARRLDVDVPIYPLWPGRGVDNPKDGDDFELPSEEG